MVIEFKDVGLCYYRKGGFLLNFKRGLHKPRYFWALRNISFNISEGETIGIIGRNGSGKSTAALLMAGVYKPDEGMITISGQTYLLALGTGFRPELSGRDNIIINATYLGHSRKYIYDHMDEIIDFAELGEFIDEPVRTYSRGMGSRLAFSIASAMEPEILIIDEVMASGDEAFKTKAEKRIQEMVSKAKTVIIISHQTTTIQKMCSRCLWIEHGGLVMDGQPEDVIKSYSAFCKDPKKKLLSSASQMKESVQL